MTIQKSAALTVFPHPQIHFYQVLGYILIYTSALSQTYLCNPQKLASSNDLRLYLVKVCFQFGSWNMDQVILPTQISFAVKHFSRLESVTPAQQLRKKEKKRKRRRKKKLYSDVSFCFQFFTWISFSNFLRQLWNTFIYWHYVLTCSCRATFPAGDLHLLDDWPWHCLAKISYSHVTSF